MLTKDLVICRCSGKRLLPVFQKTNDPELLELAERLIGACEPNGTFTRGDMLQAWSDVTTGYLNTKLLNGLRKILEDRAQFSSGTELDYPTERRRLLHASAAVLKQGNFATEEEYRKAIEATINSPLFQERLYADLPDNDRLISFRDTSPRELIERYNVALVQGLLLEATSIELDVEDASQAQLRRLFSLVRFNRLVSTAEARAPQESSVPGATTSDNVYSRRPDGALKTQRPLKEGAVRTMEGAPGTTTPDNVHSRRPDGALLQQASCQAPSAAQPAACHRRPDGALLQSAPVQATRIHFTIDGPGSVLSQSRSYGYQLARFFPAVVNLRHWSMTATIMHSSAYGTKERVLKLDETSGLTCRDAYGSYVPEEITLFRKAFAAKDSRWRFVEECPLLKGKKALLVFPDFGFIAPDGTTIYLELFHRWHANQLMQRLDQLDEGCEWPLLIGVDRAIAAKPEFQERLDSSPAFQKAGFLYRDFPTIDKLLSKLDQMSC